VAVVPLLALVPGWLAAMAVWWLPVRFAFHLRYWWWCLAYLAVGAALFWQPVQRVLLTRLLGARRPTRDERVLLEPVWAQVCQAIGLSPRRYVLAVIDGDDLNAFACGGHLVIVTSYAAQWLPEAELAAVMAHEVSHHLGLHTVALTLRLWLSLPVLALARLGFYLENVANAATSAFAHRSQLATAAGRLISYLLRAIAWVLLISIVLSGALANLVGRPAEFEADRRAVQLGFGPALADALRRFVATGSHPTRRSWRDRAFASHPPARTRIARIEAQLRHRQGTRYR
jgi:Zn-dependent protease with chaperone function